MAGTGGNQTGRDDGTAQRATVAHARAVRRAAGVLAGFCCVLGLTVALAACGQGAALAPLRAPSPPLHHRAAESIELSLALLASSPTATNTPAPTSTPTTVPTATATAAATATATTAAATATPAATATIATTATTAATASATGAATTTATAATATTGGSSSGGTSAGDNGNFYAGVVLIATGALLLLLLVVGLAAYLLVWRRRGGAVLMERSGDREPGSSGGYGSGYGGYDGDYDGSYDGYNGGMPAGPDEPTTPFGDYGARGNPGGWPDTSGGRGYDAPPQWRGGAGRGSQGGPRPPRPAR